MTEPSLPEESLFAQALELTDAAARAAFLDRACGQNQSLRAEVEALLCSHEQAGDLLDLPEDPARTTDQSADAARAAHLPAREGPGTRIGPYKLLESIGEGGMGTVWMAEQIEPMQRRVALKVVKEGMDTKHVLVRFEAERQALALMEHPHIAKVLDAGSTPSGRPYFVMELVKGLPITTYCDAQRLGVRQRLALFGDVCRAVQHAHQKGIIHRDLKPSNVLVAPYDGKPVVKVIDFGVAKATGPRLTDKTLFTGFGALVGTPEYMSPEQAAVNNQDIDTRSDIYALGVVLYELLTGSTPLTRKRLQETALLEVLRVIREEEPPRPSTRLLESQETLASISAQRQTDPAKLTKIVRGELDWITMKALEKDRNRRYETANSFALDIERYQADEPVLACPPSASYRLRKFVRRHKGPVLAATIFLLLLATGAVGTTAGLIRALAAEEQALTERDQKDEALRQKEEALRKVGSERDQKEAARRQTRQALNTLTDEALEDLLGRQVQVTDQHRDFLKKVLAYHQAFAASGADDPEGRVSQVEGCMRVASILLRLGEYKATEAALSEFQTRSEQLVADFPTHIDFRRYVAVSHHDLGNLLRETGQPRKAEAAYHKALAIQKELVSAFPERPEFRQQMAHSNLNLGILLSDARRLREAETHLEDSRTLLAKLAGDFPKLLAYRYVLSHCYNELAIVRKDTQRPEKAEQSFRRALDLQTQLTAELPHHPTYRQDLATTLNNLGVLLRAQAKYPEAESVYRDALTMRKQLAADFPSRPDLQLELAQSYNTLGNLLRFTNRPNPAETAYGDALAHVKRLADDFPKRPIYRREMAHFYANLGSFLRETQRSEKAEEAFGQALKLWEQLAQDFRPQLDFRTELARSHIDLGNLWRDAGRPQEAEAAYRKALPIRKELADEFPKRPDLRAELAQTHSYLGRVQVGRLPDEVKSEWRKARAIQEQLVADFPKVPAYQNSLAGTLVNLATLHLQQREFAKAVKLLEEARPHHQAALQANGKDSTYRQFYRNNLATLARSYLMLAEHAALATTAEELARFCNHPPDDLYDAAAYLCRCATLVGKDARLDPARRKELANNYADRALTLLQQAVARGYKDAVRFPKQPRYRQELALCYVQLGVVLNDLKRREDVAAVYREAQTIQEQLATDFPKVPAYHHDLAGTLVNLALLHHQRKDFAAAVKLLEAARPHHQAALTDNPKATTYRKYYRNNLWALADCCVGLADHVQLAAAADELARFGYDGANDTCNAASFLARCATLAGKDVQLDGPTRQQLVQSYADRAMKLLQQAVAHGYKNMTRLKLDPNLEPLRPRAEFQKLLTELEDNKNE